MNEPARSVLFLPGAAGAGAFWSPVIERLPKGWLMRAVDLPGLGSVPARPDVRSYDGLVAHIAPTILQPTAIVAQSMGAYVALQLALRCPGVITHLVLVAATGGIDVALHHAADWRGDYASAFPTAAPWACGPVPDLTGRLFEISVPVLLIWASDDAWSPLSVAEELCGKFRSASLITFVSDDHWVARSKSVETARAIQSFLGS